MRLKETAKRYWLRLPSSLRLILVYWLVTRLIFTILGTASIFLIGHYSDPAHQVVFKHIPRFTGLPFIDMWLQWDSDWYLHIAKYGYTGVYNLRHEVDIVFLPLFPYLIRLLTWPFHFATTAVALIGLAVANLSFIGGAYYLHRLVGQKFSRRVAKYTILALFLSPMGFVFSAFLTEGLFFLLLVLAFYWAEARQWWRVGLISLPLVLARPIGIACAAVLAVFYLVQSRTNWRQLLRPQSLWLLGPLLGAAIFIWINDHITGQPLGFLHSEGSGWHRGFLHLAGPSGGLWTLQGLYLVAFPLLALILVGLAARRIGWIYYLLALAMIIVPGSTGLYGLIRYTSLVFPIYIALALIIDKYRRWYEPIIMTLLIVESVHLVWWSLGMPIMQ